MIVNLLQNYPLESLLVLALVAITLVVALENMKR